MPAPKGNKYAEGNKGGRPAKFVPEMIPSIVSYIEKRKRSKKVPTVAGLALLLNCHNTSCR